MRLSQAMTVLLMRMAICPPACIMMRIGPTFKASLLKPRLLYLAALRMRRPRIEPEGFASLCLVVFPPGGRGPFDWFLRDGFDGFHLARAHHVELIDGAPVFSDIAVEMTADTLLAKHGMIPEDGIVLDRCGPVTMQVWRKG